MFFGHDKHDISPLLRRIRAHMQVIVISSIIPCLPPHENTRFIVYENIGWFK